MSAGKILAWRNECGTTKGKDEGRVSARGPYVRRRLKFEKRPGGEEVYSTVRGKGNSHWGPLFPLSKTGILCVLNTHPPSSKPSFLRYESPPYSRVCLHRRCVPIFCSLLSSLLAPSSLRTISSATEASPPTRRGGRTRRGKQK